LPPSTGTAAPAAAEPSSGANAQPTQGAGAPSSGTPGPGAAAAGRWRTLGPIPIDRRAALVAGVVSGLLLTVIWAGTGYHYEPYVQAPMALSGQRPPSERAAAQLTARLRDRERQLAARLKATAPRGVYIVIDQTHNRLYLKRDEDTLLEAVCSAGSGMVLKEGGGKKRQWVFDTPRGSFEVLSRTEDPVWLKPDWAFVEERQPIPKNPAERLEYGSLGEYALYFGNGFMIHGTLYERLLGRAVSHGCIRVGRDDLRKVWAAARRGTRIYIY
jgi:L,D-transpeptidase YbiS